MTDAGRSDETMADGTDVDLREELRRTEEQRALFASLVDGAPDAMIVTSASGFIVYANPAADALSRGEPGALIGRALVDLVDPKDLEERPMNRERVEAGETVYNQRRLVRSDQEGVWVETATRKLADGRLQFWLRDLTARNKLEVDLRTAQKLEATGLLAAGLAHDLNNLLTVIGGHAELLARSGGESTSTETIVLATRRAAELTRKLLTFARVQRIVLRPLDLNQVVRDNLPLVRSIAGEAIDLSLDLADELEPVEADAGQLDQALWNLVTNACQAMAGTGRLTLTTRNVTVDADTLKSLTKPRRDPRFVCLSVEDTGQGMDDSTAARAFDPFFTTKGAGSGLGLSVVHGIIGQHGGVTRMHTVLGRGTRFDLLLPAAKRDARTPHETAPVDPPAVAPAGIVLVVEDEPTLRRWVEGVLSNRGYDVVTAEDGHAALELCASLDAPPVVVVSDVHMPRVSGPELGARLRGLFPDVALVFMSGFPSAAVAQTLPAGSELLAKPFTGAALLAVVAAVLRTRPAESLGTASC